MRQQSLASQESFEKYGRKSRRELFLDEMNQVVPWAELEALVEPRYPKAGSGRRPVGLAIMLRVVSDPGRISPNEKQGGTWDAFFWVRDARALHAELRANGADVVYGPLVQESYQMEEFAVRDREGYVLGFGQALAGSPREA